MSEHWKSTPKYWCKHCSTYVRDTPFEKKQHESTGKHQGNLKRFLRGIQNDHERNERDKQKAKAEVDRLHKVVGGTAGASASGPSTLKRTSATPVASASPAERRKQLAQLAEMGVAVPDEYRADMALVGDWQVVSQNKIEDVEPSESLSVGVRKRKFGGHEEEEEEEEASEVVARRGWGSTTRRYPTESLADLDALLAGSKVKKEEESATGELLGSAELQMVKQELSPAAEETVVKPEESGDDANPLMEPPSTVSAAPALPVFKKRRPKAAG